MGHRARLGWQVKVDLPCMFVNHVFDKLKPEAKAMHERRVLLRRLVW